MKKLTPVGAERAGMILTLLSAGTAIAGYPGFICLALAIPGWILFIVGLVRDARAGNGPEKPVEDTEEPAQYALPEDIDWLSTAGGMLVDVDPDKCLVCGVIIRDDRDKSVHGMEKACKPPETLTPKKDQLLSEVIRKHEEEKRQGSLLPPGFAYTPGPKPLEPCDCGDPWYGCDKPEDEPKVDPMVTLIEQRRVELNEKRREENRFREMQRQEAIDAVIEEYKIGNKTYFGFDDAWVSNPDGVTEAEYLLFDAFWTANDLPVQYLAKRGWEAVRNPNYMCRFTLRSYNGVTLP